MENDDFQKVKDYALKLLSLRPRSKYELKRKLTQYSIKKGFGNDIPTNVIEDLESKGYVDDLDFSIWWIEQRRAFRPKGSYILKMELLQKGVEKEIIEQVLKNKEYGDDFAGAQKVAEKKMKIWTKLPENQAKIKLGNMLTQRGFTYDVIHKVIDSYFQKS